MQSALSLLSVAAFQPEFPRLSAEQKWLLAAHLVSVRACVAAGPQQSPVRVLHNLLLSALDAIDIVLKFDRFPDVQSLARLWLLNADAVATQIAAALWEDLSPFERATLIDLSVRAGMFPLHPPPPCVFIHFTAADVIVGDELTVMVTTAATWPRQRGSTCDGRRERSRDLSAQAARAAMIR